MIGNKENAECMEAIHRENKEYYNRLYAMMLPRSSTHQPTQVRNIKYNLLKTRT